VKRYFFSGIDQDLVLWISGLKLIITQKTSPKTRFYHLSRLNMRGILAGRKHKMWIKNDLIGKHGINFGANFIEFDKNWNCRPGPFGQDTFGTP
jgi:hypothetical protein